MNKKMILGMMMIFIAGIAMGEISQSQFDNIDFSKKSMNFSIENINVIQSKIIERIKVYGRVDVNTLYDTFEKDSKTGKWIPVTKLLASHYSFRDIEDCIKLEWHSLPFCIKRANHSLVSKIVRFGYRERKWLTSQQTEQMLDGLTANDFIITDEELN